MSLLTMVRGLSCDYRPLSPQERSCPARVELARPSPNYFVARKAAEAEARSLGWSSWRGRRGTEVYFCPLHTPDPERTVRTRVW